VSAEISQISGTPQGQDGIANFFLYLVD